MNYQTLSSHFSAASLATGACSSYDFKYLHEINYDRNGNYPKAVLIPPKKPVDFRSEYEDVDVDFWIMDEWSREDTDKREKIWDSINAVALVVFDKLNKNSSLTILNPGNIVGEVFNLGKNVDEVLAVKYTLKLRLFC